jgi:hypothetical protein
MRYLAWAAVALLLLASTSPTKAGIQLLGGPTTGGLQAQGQYNVKADYGAKGDTVQLVNAAVTGTAFSFTQSRNDGPGAYPIALTNADVGKTIAIPGAGTAGAVHITTIASVGSATTATLTASAPTTVSGVLAYYGTDDTVAIQNTINAITTFNFATGAIGGSQVGVVFSPPGIYMIAGALYTGNGANAQLYIPMLPSNYGLEPKNITIGFASTVGVNTSFQVNGGPQAPPTSGSIWFSPRAGSGTSPTILGMENNSGAFNTVLVQMQNVGFRTAYGPQASMGCADLRFAYQILVDKFVCDVAANMTTVAATAPVSGGYGLRVPGQDNGAKTAIYNSTVVGYYDAFDLYEHSYLSDVDVYFVHNAFDINASTHGLSATSLLAQHAVNVFNVTASTGSIGFFCGELRTEHGSGWYATVADLNDASNVLYGACNYRSVSSFIGAVNSFVKNGGTHFTATALQP